MKKIAALLTTFVVLASLAVVLAATDATAAPCAKLCKPSIAACRAQGFTRRSCKRALVAACKSFYPHDCAFTVDGNGNVGQCPTDYTDCGPGNGCCASDTPFCTSDGKCSQVPDTTTTTTTTVVASTSTTSTTSTTQPSNPFAGYDGTWGYAVSYAGTPQGACTTQYPTDLGGTTTLYTTPTGSIDGVIYPNTGGSVTYNGGFTSGSSAAVQSPIFSDAYGCNSTFNAYVDNWTLSSGAFEVDLYQECTPGVVCVDVYLGAIAR